MRQVNVYQFNELSETAKDKARDWYRSRIYNCGPSNMDLEDVVEEIRQSAVLCGFEDNVIIEYRLGSSQGDYACVKGIWRANNTKQQICEELLNDKQFVSISEQFNRIAKAFNALAIAKEGTDTVAGIDFDSNIEFLISFEHIREAKENFRIAIQSFNEWAFGTLQTMHAYLFSNECVDERIAVNEYEFTADGVFWSQ